MALFHLNVTQIKRSKGQSAIAAAAYRAGEKLYSEYMPDPSMSIEAMYAYGYTDSDMLPLSKERALELSERDVPIYMLYDGNTEGHCIDRHQRRQSKAQICF